MDDPSSNVSWVQIILGGGGTAALVTFITFLIKSVMDRNTKKLNHSETTVSIAIETLQAVNQQYKDISNKHDDLEIRVDNLQQELTEHKSLVEQFRDYINYLFSNWDEVRLRLEPPHLTDEIKLTIFKDK